MVDPSLQFKKKSETTLSFYLRFLYNSRLFKMTGQDVKERLEPLKKEVPNTILNIGRGEKSKIADYVLNLWT